MRTPQFHHLNVDGTLVPITGINDKYSKKTTRLKWREFWSTLTVIDGYYKDPNQIGVLEFKGAVTVRTAVLDLAVVNLDGVCRINIQDFGVPGHLTEGYKILFNERLEFFSRHNAHLRQMKELLDSSIMESEIQNGLWDATLPDFSFPAELPKVRYENGVFEFDLKRIERYRQPGVDGLLKSYSQFLSREAKEFDFAG